MCAENGGIQLDTLMIDEGFGSLDESTLDQVMQLLTGLASGGRSVALVSHVSEMKKMVSEQITVIPIFYRRPGRLLDRDNSGTAGSGRMLNPHL